MRAVITGVGAVSAFGVGVRALWDGLARGGTAVRPIQSFDAATFPTRVAGEVPLAEVRRDWLRDRIGVLPRGAELSARWSEAGMLRERKVIFAALAAAEAWRHAGCGQDERHAWLSIALGLEQAFCQDFAPIFDGSALDWSADGDAPLPPLRYRSPVDLGARAVAELLELEGPIAVHTSACAAGAMSVAHGASLIERGVADVVICGASDSMINPLGLGGMAVLGTTSPRNDPDACRPFDRRRDGLAMGEGAAMFVLEHPARASARGAKPLARVLGSATTQDAHKLSAPHPGGAMAARAIAGALRAAGLEPGAIEYINAHGTGTPLNDVAEARAIHRALGAHAARVPVSSIKGAIGHLMAASGAIEIAASLIGFERDLLPGTANHRDPDPECDLDVIGESPRRGQPEVIVSTSFGFGGQNAAVVLGRPT